MTSMCLLPLWPTHLSWLRSYRSELYRITNDEPASWCRHRASPQEFSGHSNWNWDLASPLASGVPAFQACSKKPRPLDSKLKPPRVGG